MFTNIDNFILDYQTNINLNLYSFSTQKMFKSMKIFIVILIYLI